MKILQIQRIALRRNDDLRQQFKDEIGVFNPNQLVSSMKQALYVLRNDLYRCHNIF